MATVYDVAVVGGDFDGLVAAAYLAQAGHRVVVLEAGESVGGMVATEELDLGGGPTYAPAVFGSVELLHPRVVSELGLAGHGFERIEGGGVFVPASDGRRHPEGPLFLDPRQGPVAAQVAEVSAQDGEAFSEFERFHLRVVGALAPTLTDVLPDPAPSGLGGIFQLAQLAWRLRRLGGEEMPEALRYLPMPVQDVLEERFTSAPIRAALAAPALTASWLGPRSAGSAYGLLHHRPAWAGGLVPGLSTVRGGPGGLSRAVASAFTAAGGEIRTGAAVERIDIEDGRVRGVVLDGGDEVRADRVASALDPKTTLLERVDPRWLDPETAALVERVRGHGSVALVRYLVDRRPELSGAPEDGCALSGRIQLAGHLDEIERAFDAAKYGRIPEVPWVELTVPSIVQPSLTPDGRWLVVAWVQYVPRKLRDASWSTARDLLADRVTDRIEQFLGGFTASIVGRDVVTPADLEARFGVGDGCVYHVDLTLDQLLHLRPLAGWFDHRTPIEGLYLCGPGCHPGGGVTGLPGRNAARAILRS